jgi:hypothetical protein
MPFDVTEELDQQRLEFTPLSHLRRTGSKAVYGFIGSRCGLLERSGRIQLL